MEAFGLDCTQHRCIQVAMGRRQHEGRRLSVQVAPQRFEQPYFLSVTSLPQPPALQPSILHSRLQWQSHEPARVAKATLLASRTSALMAQQPGGGGVPWTRVVKLRRRELNPGLPRDRRKYSPLYYSGSAGNVTARSSSTALLLSVGPAFLNLRAGRGPSEF